MCGCNSSSSRLSPFLLNRNVVRNPNLSANRIKNAVSQKNAIILGRRRMFGMQFR